MTCPGQYEWQPSDSNYRHSEVSAIIGNGDEVWQRAASDVLRWKVKTASGFAVESAGPVSPGERMNVTASFCGLTVLEPVEVVAVVEQPNRVGFSYRTMPGHPVCGEEAFIVHRRGEEVRLTIRSLTRAASHQPWRALYPLLRVAQLLVRRRYLRALR